MDEGRGFGGIHPVHDLHHDSLSATRKQGTSFGPGASKVSAGGMHLVGRRSRRCWTISGAMRSVFPPYFALWLSTGLRNAEVIALTWDCLRMDGGEMLRKNSRYGSVNVILSEAVGIFYASEK